MIFFLLFSISVLANSASLINYETEASTIWSNSNLTEMIQAQMKINPKSFDNNRFYNLSQTISPPKVVFLTGSSGYLGAYLLYSALTSIKNLVIHCLVRANDSATVFKSFLVIFIFRAYNEFWIILKVISF